MRRGNSQCDTEGATTRLETRSLARGYSDLSFFVVFVLLLFDCSVWKDSRAVFHHVDNECKTKMTKRIAPLMCHLHLRH